VGFGVGLKWKDNESRSSLKGGKYPGQWVFGFQAGLGFMKLLRSVGGRVNFLFRNIIHIRFHTAVSFSKNQLLIQPYVLTQLPYFKKNWGRCISLFCCLSVYYCYTYIYIPARNILGLWGLRDNFAVYPYIPHKLLLEGIWDQVAKLCSFIYSFSMQSVYLQRKVGY
jgi:hypothetical protein